VGAQCNKLATVDNSCDGRPVVAKSRKIGCSEFGTRSTKEVPLVLDVPKFLCNTVLGKPSVACVPKINSIHSVVSMEHRLVTDGQTDTGSCTALYVLTRRA